MNDLEPYSTVVIQDFHVHLQYVVSLKANPISGRPVEQGRPQNSRRFRRFLRSATRCLGLGIATPEPSARRQVPSSRYDQSTWQRDARAFPQRHGGTLQPANVTKLFSLHELRLERGALTNRAIEGDNHGLLHITARDASSLAPHTAGVEKGGVNFELPST